MCPQKSKVILHYRPKPGMESQLPDAMDRCGLTRKCEIWSPAFALESLRALGQGPQLIKPQFFPAMTKKMSTSQDGYKGE